MEPNDGSEDSLEAELRELQALAFKINPVELEISDLLEVYLEVYLHLHRIEERIPSL